MVNLSVAKEAHVVKSQVAPAGGVVLMKVLFVVVITNIVVPMDTPATQIMERALKETEACSWRCRV